MFSIIIATHNRPEQLSVALSSITNQSYNNLQIVLVCDEGSKETKEVATKHLRDHDVFLCVPEAKGPSETRNMGCGVAHGDWICFLDDDDFLERDYLEKLHRHLVDPSKVYYVNYKVYSESNIDLFSEASRGKYRKISTKASKETLYVRNHIPINAFFVHKNVSRAAFFDENLQTHEDWDYLLSLNIKHAIEFSHIDEFGPIVCDSSSSSRRNKDDKMVHLLDYIAIYRRWTHKKADIANQRSQFLKKHGIQLSSKFF